MKNYILLLATFFAVVFSGCSKDEATTPIANTNPKIELTQNLTVDGLNRSFYIYMSQKLISGKLKCL